MLWLQLEDPPIFQTRPGSICIVWLREKPFHDMLSRPRPAGYDERRNSIALQHEVILLGKGLEPLWIAPLDPKSSASANSATRAAQAKF